MHTVYNIYQGTVYADTPLNTNDETATFSNPSVALGQFINHPLNEYDAMPKSAIEALEKEMARINSQIIKLEGEYSELNNLWVKTVSKD